MKSELYTAAQGLLARQIQLDAIAHNIANVSTTGFRETSPFFKSYNHALLDGPGNVMNNAANNQPVASGVFMHDRQGAIKETGNPLDLAIQGEGFFKLNTPFGPRYTRNGDFNLNTEGQMVTAAGHLLLDTNDQPITLSNEFSNFHINSRGEISQNGNLVTRIKLVTFADNNLLVPEENTVLAMQDPLAVEQQADGAIAGRALEGSNINIAKQMVDLITAQRAYEMNTRTIRSIDSSMTEQAIRGLGPR